MIAVKCESVLPETIMTVKFGGVSGNFMLLDDTPGTV